MNSFQSLRPFNLYFSLFPMCELISHERTNKLYRALYGADWGAITRALTIHHKFHSRSTESLENISYLYLYCIATPSSFSRRPMIPMVILFSHNGSRNSSSSHSRKDFGHGLASKSFAMDECIQRYEVTFRPCSFSRSFGQSGINWARAPNSTYKGKVAGWLPPTSTNILVVMATASTITKSHNMSC